MKSLRVFFLIAAVSFTAIRPVAAQEKANPFAVALGATGAQAVFSNFMAIAELADLYGSKTYDKQKAADIATTYGKLTESAKESLTDLVDSGKLTKDDAASVQEMVVINDLLGKMAAAIVTYVKEPTEENEAAYQKNRTKAWNAIQKFLGIQN